MLLFVRHLIVPLARRRDWRDVCEIGASTGLSTDELLKLPVASYTIIDPCFDADLDLKYAGDERVTVHKRNSLDALQNLAGSYDCILIDGDHNWYTVFNELRLIRQRDLLRLGGTIFFHDIAWPYGRRDLYYQPNTIPPEFRLEYERKGIIRGRNQLADEGGTSPKQYNAVREGGPRNGVLTAIEDFHALYPSDYDFSLVKAQFGLGILQCRRNRKSVDPLPLLLRINARMAGLYGLVGGLKRRLSPAR
jgi:hypothetical protein